MNISSAIRGIFKDPLNVQMRVMEKFASQYLVRRQQSLAAKMGMKRSAFLLSFDCDTKKDFEVAWDVHDKLNRLGIMPGYAVPGELLEAGKDVYKKIAHTGAEFINHGYLEHTVYKPEKGEYQCTLFYNDLSVAEIANDIDRGQSTLKSVLGVDPEGFRAPHFGSLRATGKLEQIYRILAGKGYRYSTSATPDAGIRQGPAFNTLGIIEVPVTGGITTPATILDSYTYLYSGSKKLTKTAYIDEIYKIADVLSDPNVVMLVNLYADPSQVYDWPEFFEAMAQLAPYNVHSFPKLLDEHFL